MEKPGQVDDDSPMEAILTTNNQGLLAVFETVLGSAEIPYFIRGAEASSLMTLNATIVVPHAHAEAARDLLRETVEWHEPQD